MRLIATPNLSVNSVDRALWLTIPFDKSMKEGVTPKCRIYTVPQTSRVYHVKRDNRTVTVPRDNRTYKVTCE